MSVAKVIELMAESRESWEDATQKVVKEASRTIENIKSVYIKDMQAIVDEEEITKYRINAKVTFIVKEN
ncbi:MAG: dodecin family protein [Anaerolineales bacterium]|nr:dodecin family protein [Anaerolineales bacterium]